MLSLIKYLPVLLIGIWLFSLPVALMAQNFLVFHPKKLASNHVFKLDCPYEEFLFPLSAGDSINALLIKSPVQPSKGVVLYFHGNADNLQRWANYHVDMTSRGYDFFIMDYRGYGKSSGKPKEQHMYDDARFCYDFLLQHYAAADIILYGRSLGTGIAARLATEVSAKCLILETPYNTINFVIARHIFMKTLPFPLQFHFQTVGHFDAISYPILALHGTADKVIPYSCAAALIPHLREKDRFVTIPGGTHRNLSSYPAYQEALNELLK